MHIYVEVATALTALVCTSCRLQLKLLIYSLPWLTLQLRCEAPDFHNIWQAEDMHVNVAIKHIERQLIQILAIEASELATAACLEEQGLMILLQPNDSQLIFQLSNPLLSRYRLGW